MMFCASDYEVDEEIVDNYITAYINDDILLHDNSWKKILDVDVGDKVLSEDEVLIVSKIEVNDKYKTLYF